MSINAESICTGLLLEIAHFEITKRHLILMPFAFSCMYWPTAST